MNRTLAALGASVLALAACETVHQPNPAAPAPAVVHAFAETAPVGSGDDAADDPAIWLNKSDPAKSLVFGTDKQAGLYAYDLAGNQVQFLNVGALNNADLRQQIDMGDGPVDIMGASNRTTNSLTLVGIHPQTGEMRAAGDFVTSINEPYGFCIGHDAKGWLAAIPYKSNQVQIWRLENGKPAPVARTWPLDGKPDSQAEGCVIDEENGAIYVSEEDVGLWRFDYSGETFASKKLIDTSGSATGLLQDVEGVTIWRDPNGGGYIIVSSQGDDRYIVYDRKAPNAFRGAFRIADTADGKIDGASVTDGIDASSAALGPDLPRGLFVAQDDENPGSTQNFKFVDWREIEKALKLN
jgi:3-phytase